MKRFLACVVLLWGCGGEPEPVTPPECLDTELPMLETPARAGETPKEAVLAVEVRRLADESVGAGEFKILFQDLSTYDGDPAPFAMDSPNCWRTTGQPVIRTPPTPLRVAAVRVTGLTGGPDEVGEVDGVHRSAVREALLGSGPVGFSGSEITGEASYPGFEVSGEAALPVEGLTFAREQVGGDLELRWTPGNGTWLELQLVTEDPARPGDPAGRNRITCRVADDGCHRIPPGALDWLSIYDVRSQVRVERHLTTLSAPADGALATLDTIQTVLNEVDLTDGHFVKDENP